jgi:hypothetical protein
MEKVSHSGSNTVSGNTFILTKDGYVKIRDVVEKEVEVWNGKEFSKVVVRKSPILSRMLKVTITNGLTLRCTIDHKFLLSERTNYNPLKANRCDARFLQKGDRLTNFLIPSGYSLENKTCSEYETYGKESDGKGKKRGVTSVQNLIVENVEMVESEEETFGFNEPINNAGVFNGILTGTSGKVNTSTKSCLSGDMLIKTKKGMKRIDECDGEEVFTPYISDEDIGYEPSYTKSSLVIQGYMPLYQIDLACGVSLKATEEHKFLTENVYGDYKWKEVKDLNNEDRIVMRFDPKDVVLDSGFVEGKNKNDEHDLLSSLQKSEQQSSMLLGFVYKRCKYTNNIFTVEAANVRELVPYFLDLGIVGIVYDSPSRLVIQGINAQRLADYLNLPFEDDIVDYENSEFSSKILYSPELVSGTSLVYDLYVPERHHFIVSGAVSHNCSEDEDAGSDVAVDNDGRSVPVQDVGGALE